MMNNEWESMLYWAAWRNCERLQSQPGDDWERWYIMLNTRADRLWVAQYGHD